MSTYRNRCMEESRNTCGQCAPCPCPVCPACSSECCTSDGSICPDGKGSFLNGYQAQLSNAAEQLLGENHNILFDHIINEGKSGIIYDSITGQFTLCAYKSYYISWWLTVNGTETVPSVEIAAVIDNRPFVVASSPLVTCQMSGSALIPAARAPQVLSIMNVSRNPIRYAKTGIQANIIIIELAV